MFKRLQLDGVFGAENYCGGVQLELRGIVVAFLCETAQGRHITRVGGACDSW